MIWVAATYERAGEPIEAASVADVRVARGRRGRARRRDRRQGPRRDRRRRVVARHATRSTDDVMTLADLDARQPRGGRAREHLLLPCSRAPRPAAAPRSGCSGRWPARSRGFPSSASSGSRRTASTRAGTDATAFAGGARATRRGSGCPAATSSFPTVHQVDDGGRRARRRSRERFPPDLAAAAARRSCASPPRRCSRTTRPTRRTAGRTASRCRRRCSASRPGCPTRRGATAIAATYVVAFRAAEGSARHRPRVASPSRTRVGARRRARRRSRHRGERGVPRAPTTSSSAIVPELAARAGQPRRRAPREVHARVLRRGRRRPGATPPLPRGRRVPRRLVVEPGVSGYDPASAGP